MKRLKKCLIKLLTVSLIAGLLMPSGLTRVFAVELKAPTDLTAEVNPTYISLNWRNGDENFYYTVLEKSTDQTGFYPIATLYRGTTSYKDYGVSNGHVYTYRARTFYGSYTSPYSPETDAIPLYPVNFTVTRSTSNQVDLEWQYPTVPTVRIPDYETLIERRPSGSDTWTLLTTLPSSETGYRDTTVLTDSVYYYRIRTRYPNGTYSAYIPYDSGLSTRTSYPLTTFLSGYAVSDTQIMLEWDLSKADGGSAILQKKGSDGQFYTIYNSNYSNAYTDSWLTKGRTYTYRLMLQSKNGSNSEFTNEVDVIAETVPSPYELTASVVSSDKVILSWAYPYETETGFELWRKASGSWELLTTLPKNTQDYSDNSVLPGQTYIYKVRAVRGDTAFSRFAQSNTVQNQYPETPGRLVYYTAKNRLNIYSYENVPAGASYTLEIRESINSQWLDYKTVTDGTLIASVAYSGASKYQFRLRSSIGNLSSYSPEFYFFGSAPDPAQSFKASITGWDRVMLTWKDTGLKEEGYEIYRTVHGERKLLGSLDKDAETFTDEDPAAGAEAIYELMAYNTSGRSAAVYAKVTVPNISAFKDIANYSWAHSSIYTLYGLGAFDWQNGYFYPGRTVTLGQLAHIILKSFDIPYAPQGLFTVRDLSTAHPYYKDIITAVSLGIVNPDISGRIYPDKSVTRGNILYFLNNTLNHLNIPLTVHDPENLEVYSDHDSVAAVDIPIIASFAGDGIITGKSNQVLGLSQLASKAECAVIVCRTLEKYRLGK